MLTSVADGVLVHESATIRSNTVVVVGDADVLLVDPGLTNAELRCLAGDLGARGLRVVVGFATHPDWDHALWHPDLGAAPRFGTMRCATALETLLAEPDWREQLAEVLPDEVADDLPLEQFGRVTGLPEGATEVPWSGPRVRVLEHRAHADGHAALLIAERGVLVAGDMVSDVLVPMPDLHSAAADPLGDYLAGLDLLESVADHVDVVVPGHGAPADGVELRERIARDRDYIAALRDGRDIADPRIQTPQPGWEWVRFIHEGNVAAVAAAR